jgi:hypothetical protein
MRIAIAVNDTCGDKPMISSDIRQQTWTLLQDMLREDLAITVSSHELSKTECPNCLNLHLQDGRSNAGQLSLHLVGQNRARVQDYPGVKP